MLQHCFKPILQKDIGMGRGLFNGMRLEKVGEEAFDLLVELSSLDCFVDDGHDLRDIKWLRDIIKDPVSNGFNGTLQRPVTSDDDDHDVLVDPSYLLQGINPRNPRHFKV